jgi:hypothetical protein
MWANKTKYFLKTTLFLIGVLLFATSGFVIYYGLSEGNIKGKVGEMGQADLIVLSCFFVGAYITTNLLKGKTRTKWEMDEGKEIQKKNRNNGN